MKSIVIAGFGSSGRSLRARTFEPIESEAAEEFPDRRIIRAFIGKEVLDRIRSRGGEALSLDEALEGCISEGSESIAVMPALPIAGNQFRQIQSICGTYADRTDLRLCGPLLCSRESASEFLGTLPLVFPEAFSEGCGLAMMGHGRGMEADGNLCLLQHLASLRSMKAFFVTVSGTPSAEDAIKMMAEAGVKKVFLAPLMFEAGFHARRDMAAENNSIRSAFASAGFEVECIMKGMGEIPEFRRLFLSNLKKSLDE